MQPTFGTIIWDMLFEPMTAETKAIIVEDVNRIINYDPRVQISDTNISTYETGIQLVFTLSYSIYNLTETIQLRFDEDNGLSTR
jgi:phage baseplate assembly protein W